MNLDDGNTLTAFSIRRQQFNSAPLHAYASLRPRGGSVQHSHRATFAFQRVPNGGRRARAPRGRSRVNFASAIARSSRSR